MKDDYKLLSFHRTKHKFVFETSSRWFHRPNMPSGRGLPRPQAAEGYPSGGGIAWWPVRALPATPTLAADHPAAYRISTSLCLSRQGNWQLTMPPHGHAAASGGTTGDRSGPQDEKVDDLDDVEGNEARFCSH